MKISASLLSKALLVGLGGLGFASTAGAVTYTINPATASAANAAPGNTTSLTVRLTGDGATTTVQTRVDYNTTIFDVTAAAAAGAPAGTTCLANDGTGRVAIIVSPSVPPAALASADLCTLSVTVATGATPGAYTFSFDAASTIPAASPAATGSTVTVTANTPPTIGAGVYTAGTPTGTEGTVTSIGNIAFPIPTPAAGSGSGSVQCVDAAGGPNFTFNPSAATTVNSATAAPVNVGVSCPLSPAGGGTVTGNATCTVTDSAGTRSETIAIGCPAGTPQTGPTLAPPASTTVTLGSTLVGQQSTGNIQYTATGGNAGQSTALTCTTAAPVSIISGGTQTVNTGATPAPIVVGVTLTSAAQTGTVTCNGTAFTINAPAGVVFVAPTVIPASSLWSQLSLIALFAALGGLFVAMRRNG